MRLGTRITIDFTGDMFYLVESATFYDDQNRMIEINRISGSSILILKTVEGIIQSHKKDIEQKESKQTIDTLIKALQQLKL